MALPEDVAYDIIKFSFRPYKVTNATVFISKIIYLKYLIRKLCAPVDIGTTPTPQRHLPSTDQQHGRNICILYASHRATRARI